MSSTAATPKAVAAVGQALFRNATSRNNVAAQIFFLKTRAKWNEAPVDINATIMECPID